MLLHRTSTMGDIKEQSYFADVPKSLAKSCDTLLLLDDGTKLPVHAAILARSSELFSDMLDGGPLAAASQINMVVIPISECTKDVANRLLSIIYTGKYQKHITESSALSLASLGHKLNSKVITPPSIIPCHIEAGLLVVMYKMALPCHGGTDDMKHSLLLQDVVEVCDEHLADLAGFSAHQSIIPWRV